MKKLLIVLIFYYSLFITHYSLSQWVYQNPLPQGVKMRDVDFVNQNTGWAVGQLGSIMKTVNGGINWTLQTSWTKQDLLSVDFINSNTGYCAGYGGKILKTTNGGTNWITLQTNCSDYFQDISFVSTDTGWACSNNITGWIYRTTNGGSSWLLQASVSNTYSLCFINNNTGWCSCPNGIILKTTNSGNNWFSQVSGTTKDLFDIYFVDLNTGWSVGRDSIIIKTTNGGNNWNQQIGTGHGNFYKVKFIDINTGWISTQFIINKPVIKTTNGGLNWVAQTVNVNDQYSGISFIDANTGWRIGDMDILKTTNGGNNWNFQSYSFSPSFRDIFAPSYNIVYAISSGNSIFKSTNSGTNWFLLPYDAGNVTYSSLFFINDNTGWAVYTGLYNSRRIIKSTNGGYNWVTQTSDTSVVDIQFIDINTGWAFGGGPSGNGVIIKTTDSGNNWFLQANFPNGFMKGFMIDGITGFAVGYNGFFVKTTNGGNNWNSYSTGVTQLLRSVYFTNPNTGWIVGGSSTLRITTNGGINWTAQTPSENGDLWSVRFSGNDTGLICGDYGAIMKTTNRGTNWITKTYGKSPLLKSIFYLNSNIVWSVGDNGVILKNMSAGENEFLESSGYKNNVNQNIPPFSTIYDSVYINAPGIIVNVNWALDTILYAPDSNLVFTLIHNGIYDTLIYQAGGSGSNFIRTKISDTSTIPITMGSPPFTDTYRPYKPLSMFNGSSAGGLWILRISSKGVIQRSGVIKSWGITVTYNNVTGIKSISKTVPGSFRLYQNYPNPFNPETIIKYDLKSNVFVKLKVYDILGREIITLVNGDQSAGSYEVTFNGRGFASSVYFYKLEVFNQTSGAGAYTETKKMVLIK
jgi:photosystem II stability/assembly factor-like uncharacterized protein